MQRRFGLISPAFLLASAAIVLSSALFAVLCIGMHGDVMSLAIRSSCLVLLAACNAGIVVCYIRREDRPPFDRFDSYPRLWAG